MLEFQINAAAFSLAIIWIGVRLAISLAEQRGIIEKEEKKPGIFQRLIRKN